MLLRCHKICSDSQKIPVIHRCAKTCTQNLANSHDQPTKLNQVAVEHVVTGMTTGFKMLILLPVFFLITETMF